MTTKTLNSKSEGVAESFTKQDEFVEAGLGERYYNRMATRKGKLHQVNAVTGFLETNESVRSGAVQVAMELRSKKIKTTDIVVVCSRQHAEQTVAVLGILFAGAIVAPVDPDVSHEECSAFLETMVPKVVFCDPRAVGQITRVLAEQGRTKSCQIVVFGSSDPESFKNFRRQEPDPSYQATRIDNPRRAVAFILLTQGTQGVPKMVCVSHTCIYRQTQQLFRVCNDMKIIVSYFSLTSMIQTALMCASFEDQIIRILPGDFGERLFCSYVHDLRIDHAMLTVEYAKKIRAHPALQDFDLSCLQCIVIGGVRLSALVISRIRSAFQNIKVIQIYGLVEVGLVAAFSEDDYHTALENPLSVGKVLPDVKIRVVDLETRKALGPNARGELLVKGDSLMLGYLKDPETTAASMEKGYFKTTDLAEYDEEGFLYTEGTLSELIVIDGKRIVPLEIEEVLQSHDLIDEAAVISDGHEMVACIIKKTDGLMEIDKDDVIDFISRSLPESRRPNKVVFFEYFPKTSGGKIKREELMEKVFRKRFRKANSLAIV